MLDPRSTSQGSIMPSYAFLADTRLDRERIPRVMTTMRKLGVPYDAAAIQGASAAAEAQAKSIADGLAVSGDADAPPATDLLAPLAYLCSPFLIWAALRFGLRAATLGLTVFGLICYWHTANGLGPFAILGANDWTSLLYLQGFLATSVVTLSLIHI